MIKRQEESAKKERQPRAQREMPGICQTDKKAGKTASAAVGLGVRELAAGGFFTALIAVGAFIKISIPVQPFPMNFTLQFFFVLLAALLLGARQAFLCVLTYLAVGLVGVPIFAAGGGPAYLLRPTFGFLLGFAAAAWVTGTVSEKLRSSSLKSLMAACLCGFTVMYLSGMFYFYFLSNYVIHMPVTAGVVFVNCFLLTAGGDLLLCFLASLTARRLKPMMAFLR